ncbi:hypothetical protein MMC30_005213 [Trapelia coarctata]|nr:hypothetical protein [Trapelia coarctata]
MAEGQLLVASAVILPDTTEQVSPPLSSKRRQSSVSEIDSKRPRLSKESSLDQADGRSPPPAKPKRNPKQDESRKLEERKRGKRLFGALLGTLAQSSSSTAQKRRLDIEKKQQAKLKQQAEEHDELKKQRLDALMEIRRQEQKKYNKQSMQIRHSNLLATAHFLQTKAEPKLYYKPCDLLSDDEAKIKSQIEAAETTVERETAEFKAQDPEAIKTLRQQEAKVSMDLVDHPSQDLETVGQVTNAEGPNDPLQDSNANHLSTLPVEHTVESSATSDVSKDHVDDGGEVLMEGEEDTVIY